MNNLELKEIRESLKLTQGQLAEVLDVKENSVYRWEAGRVPISQAVAISLESISQAKITKDDFVGNEPMTARTYAVAPHTRIVFNLRVSDSTNLIVRIGAFKFEGEFFRILTAENRGSYLHISTVRW